MDYINTAIAVSSAQDMPKKLLKKTNSSHQIQTMSIQCLNTTKDLTTTNVHQIQS